MADIKKVAFYGSAYGDLAFLLGSLLTAANETVLIRDLGPRPVTYCVGHVDGIDPVTDIISFKGVSYTCDREAKLDGETIEFVLYGTTAPSPEEAFAASIYMGRETEEDLAPLRVNEYPKTEVNCMVIRESSGTANRFFSKAAKEKGFTDVRFFKPDPKETSVRLALEFTRRLQPGREGRNMEQLMSDLFLTLRPDLTAKDIKRVVASADKEGR